tara:strand:+ start:3066 stop:3440 length:375 start_codon:yes stop_codon:yes gene_type:complete
MKAKITLLVFEVDDRHSPFVSDYLKVLTDESLSLPSRFISTKSLRDTTQELYDEYTHLDVRYANTVLVDIRIKDSELEILYKTMVPHGIMGLKKGHLLPPSGLDLEDFYERAVIEQPRSVSQRY